MVVESVFTVEEVSKHNSTTDCWLIISNRVYNVTSFLSSHPGGKNVILKVSGKDATKEFLSFHNAKDVLNKYGKELCIGILGTAVEKETHPSTTGTTTTPSLTTFGELTPYGDPSWYQGWNSIYFRDSHRKFRSAMRDFVESEVMPFVHEWDEEKSVSKELWEKAYRAGWLPGVIGPPWPTQYAGTHIAGGVAPEEFDAFHELILQDELARCGASGFLWAISGGLSIGLPPILNHGSEYLREKVCRDCLTGRKCICLCITEPSAGSDVANLQTFGQKTADGKFYVVNGEKKFITNGAWADYFTVAVRTGGSGMDGISLLLIERSMQGVSTRQMKCSGVWSSGTAYVTFEDVHVPVENLIGRENQGFRYVMQNFNHERWGTIVHCARLSRVCFEDAFKYAHKRKTFGQRLIDHPVIRQKLGHMTRLIEATYAWLENITYQMCTMSKTESVNKLGGPMALLKVQATQTFEFCAREAFQIFGGLAYTRGGQGQKIERLYREVRAYALGGGSEEILLDLGIRQAVKQAKL